MCKENYSSVLMNHRVKNQQQQQNTVYKFQISNASHPRHVLSEMC